MAKKLPQKMKLQDQIVKKEEMKEGLKEEIADKKD